MLTFKLRSDQLSRAGIDSDSGEVFYCRKSKSIFKESDEWKPSALFDKSNK